MSDIVPDLLSDTSYRCSVRCLVCHECLDYRAVILDVLYRGEVSCSVRIIRCHPEHSPFGYACEALRCGAWDYLLKPIQADKLIAAVELIIREKLHGTIHHVSKEEEEDPVLGKKLSELPTLINKLLAMVRAEYRQNITLKSIADRLRMNSTYLGQLFIKETGLKFSEYVMLYRLNTARDHILYTDEKIAVIAEEVGYSNLNYFYTHFRSYFNMTPSEMRLHKSDAVNRKD